MLLLNSTNRQIYKMPGTCGEIKEKKQKHFAFIRPSNFSIENLHSTKYIWKCTLFVRKLPTLMCASLLAVIHNSRLQLKCLGGARVQQPRKLLWVNPPPDVTFHGSYIVTLQLKGTHSHTHSLFFLRLLSSYKAFSIHICSK